MAKTDWTLTDTVKPDDFNNIGREINQLRTDVDQFEVPTASLTEAGIVQLSNATNSTSEAQAATSKAVKAAYDAGVAAQVTANAANSTAAAAQATANQAFQLGNERKQQTVDILIAKGISASTSESWDSLIIKLNSIVKASGDAVAADVLSGKTFSNTGANNLTGTMPNRSLANSVAGWADGTSTVGRLFMRPAAGYWDGTKFTYYDDPDFKATNILEGVNIFGLQGTLQRGKKFAKGVISPSIPSRDTIVIAGLDFTPGILIYSSDDSSGKHKYGVAFRKDNFGIGNITKDIAMVGWNHNVFKTPFFSFNNNSISIQANYDFDITVWWVAIEL